MKRPGGFDEPLRPPPSRVSAPSSAPPASSKVSSASSGRESLPSSSPVSSLPSIASISEQSAENGAPLEVAEGAKRREDRPRREARSDGVRRARERLKRAERERKNREKREQRRFTAHRRRRRINWTIGVSAVLGLALFVAAGVFTPVMAVRDIQVHGTEAIDAEELRGALGRFEGVPLALVSDEDVRLTLASFPLIERYAIERIPPATLRVRVEERHPVIALERGRGFDLFDPAGVLLFRVDEPPVGVPVGGESLGDTSSAAFRAAATVVRDLPEDLREQVVAVQADNAQDVRLMLSSGTEVVWGEAREIQRKAVVLRSVLEAVNPTPVMVDVSAPETPVFR